MLSYPLGKIVVENKADVKKKSWENAQDDRIIPQSTQRTIIEYPHQ